LLPKVIERASSWIQLNPEIEFNLWTNLEDDNELQDFFKNVDIDGEFRKNVIIHYKEDTYSVLKKFCEEQLHVNWSSYQEILDNKTDNSSMLLKTDPSRCAILYEHGGWYSDFNDTYCFVPLKYIVENSSDNKIYCGCDENKNFNNYILYSPKGNSEWLEHSTKIFENSFILYKFLMSKDERFVKSLNECLQECLTELEQYNQCKLFEIVLSIFYKHMPIINKAITEACADINSNLSTHFLLKNENLLLLIKYLFIREFPNSSLTKLLDKEISNVRNFTLRKRKLNVLYHDLRLVKEVTIEPAMIHELKSAQISAKTAYNLLFEISIRQLLHLVNIGTFIQKKNTNVYQIPNCYVYESFSFLTVLGHIGDGSCCGNSVYEYNEKSI
jgi:hypothetical protein